ncbi:MAG: AAA family ATPase [Bacillota bacterium]|nr:AAA family ATPase [Bacillota bacterium]
MKIIDMYIYGFGKLENVNIENIKDFQIFYGENEAGKSTIMSFIHGILFGFQTKTQNELRYEPKLHSKYGGKLRVIFPSNGYAVIERVKGKTAAGDVTVTLENGTTGGEELLKQLLSSVDKGLFQSIFSFNLHGLQNINQMKREEIGKFLFSAGALGSERLSYTETEIQKELDNRFKPGGKKPLLNEKLLAIHQLNEELKKAARKNQEYTRLVKLKEELQKEMDLIQGSLRQIGRRINKLSEWKKIQPLVLEERWIENEVEKLEKLFFPAKGIEKLERLHQLLPSLKAQISSLSERAENLKKEIELVKPNQPLLEAESDILGVIDQIPLYEQLDLQQNQEEIKLLEFNDKLEEIKEKLHLTINEEELLAINTNIFIKDQVLKLSEQGKILNETKEKLDIQFNEEKKQLEEFEENIRHIESRLIPIDERAIVEKQLLKSNDKRNLDIELKTVQEKISLYKKIEEQEKINIQNLKKQKQIQLFSFGLILFVAAVFGLVFNQLALSLVALFLLVAVGMFFFKSRAPKKVFKNNELLNLLEEERRLAKELESTEYHQTDMSLIHTKIALDDRLKEELQVQRIKLEQQLIQYEKVISKFEKWESESIKYKNSLKEMCAQLKIPMTIAHSFLYEAFLLIEQYKTILKDKRLLLERLDNFKMKKGKFLEELQCIVNRFLLNQQNLNVSNIAFVLRNMLKEEQEKSAFFKEKQQKLFEINTDLEQLKQEIHHIEGEKIKLFQEANVENEQQFYERGNETEKREKLLERLTDIQQQLQSTYLSKLERISYLQISDSDEIISEHEEEAETLKLKITKLQEHHASLKMEIQSLEEGGLYSELLHQFREKKYELEEAAKEWAVYGIAQDILSKTIEKYKNIHMPKMLGKAEGFLSFLTDGQYIRILPQSTGTGFLIERSDHTIFEANELSQATTEQVYVSIRLALVTTLYEKFQFPIVIDDSFVNFDEKRTGKMITLLKTFKQNQILFFTCHAHILKHFQEKDIYSLKASYPFHLLG